MSDTLCGPSNALQNFQKHASVDRTLQQDRLASRQSSTQGFRSQSPRDGILDPEFAAFEANLAGPALPNLQHPAHFGGPVQRPVNAHPSANWASDFQTLQISAPAPSQLQGPSISQAQGGWQNEFIAHQQRSQQGPAHLAQNNSTANRAYQPAFAPSYPMYNNNLDSTFQAPQQAHAEHVAPTEQFDESAFEAAFEQARADMEHQEAQITPNIEEHMQETNPVESIEPQEEIRIGSDTILQTDQQDPQNRTRDADALAQTAGELLDSVRHDQNQKFQQSNFLALMRRIRDREVEVEGDDFREVSSNP
ncbi:hypothetical protein N7478_006755 [Penicillium angulare]|uniref:uncharacterized protein n=1 Tax=Penicillium angulare TaxID=116970 RepID=UPI0025409B43|nr:uncharacterized protein N7478_006755 [Penicillium angulare]KAJ5281383.1 hypothetical protein N7478_006755 [Penicillium angulare]